MLALLAGGRPGRGRLAYALAAHRDQGAGLIPARPGSPRAGPWLRGPLGLAWRLQRGGLAGWALGLFVRRGGRRGGQGHRLAVR